MTIFIPLYYSYLFTNIHTFTNIITSAQSVLTYSKLTIETLDQGVKYVQS